MAVEEYLFLNLPTDGEALVLWRNEPCVVIGRHQNPWIECNLPAMEADEVPVVRRISGGGTVYHDLGNINFTFMAHSGGYNLDLNYQMVTDALAKLGVTATRNPRNDLVVGNRKVSGSAFRHTRTASLHHGTLLVDADTERLKRYLSAQHLSIESKGIDSVRSEVTTLSALVANVTAEAVRDAVSETYQSRTGAGSPVHIGADFAAVNTAIRTRVTELEAWEWRFGRTPRFCRHVSLNAGTLEIEVYHGHIVDLRNLRHEPAGPAGVGSAAQELTAALRGVRYASEDLIACAAKDPTHRDDILKLAEGLN